MQIHLVDLVENHFGTKAFGMGLETHHQIWALHAFGISRPVVHVGGGHQLTALGNASNQSGLQIGAGGVHGCGVTGWA